MIVDPCVFLDSCSCPRGVPRSSWDLGYALSLGLTEWANGLLDLGDDAVYGWCLSHFLLGLVLVHVGSLRHDGI